MILYTHLLGFVRAYLLFAIFVTEVLAALAALTSSLHGVEVWDDVLLQED